MGVKNEPPFDLRPRKERREEHEFERERAIPRFENRPNFNPWRRVALKTFILLAVVGVLVKIQVLYVDLGCIFNPWGVHRLQKAAVGDHARTHGQPVITDKENEKDHQLLYGPVDVKKFLSSDVNDESDYRPPSATNEDEETRVVESRIQSILSTLSLEEKIHQLDMYTGGSFVSEGAVVDKESFPKGGVGAMHDFYPLTADATNLLQSYATGKIPPSSTSSDPSSPKSNSTKGKKAKEGVPILFIEECLHGLLEAHHTLFPQSIGLASTFDPQLVKRVGRAIATEARAFGIHMCLAPVLGIARDPRWGRVEETFGEDTFLASQMGLALITGLQNDGNLTSPTSVIAEPKHFAAHSIPEGGRNLGPAQLGPREFFRSFAPVFETALLHGDAQSVMSAYSEIDGVPCSANKALLRTLLRDMWRFKGFVLSDLGAINMLWSWHRVAQTPKEAIRQFLTAGGNMQFYDFSHETWETAVRELVESGEVPMQMLDSRVKDVLRVKMRLGLFENPFTEGELVERHVNTKKHKELALQAARQSIVMLFNKDGALPFDLKSERRAGTGGHMQENNDNDGDMETIAIIGPTVDAPHFGDYSNGAPDPDNIVTLLEGVKRIISQTTTPSTNKPRVVYAPGTGILNNAETYPIRGHWFKSIPPNPTSARKSPTTDNDYSQYTSPGILGTYYTTPNFTSPPLLTRTDSAGINFDYFIWGSPLASPRLPSNEFSAVWEGILDMREEVERVMKLPGEKVNGLIEVDSDGDPMGVKNEPPFDLRPRKERREEHEFERERAIPRFENRPNFNPWRRVALKTFILLAVVGVLVKIQVLYVDLGCIFNPWGVHRLQKAAVGDHARTHGQPVITDKENEKDHQLLYGPVDVKKFLSSDVNDESDYRPPSATNEDEETRVVESRIQSILSTLSLEEKIHQLDMYTGGSFVSEGAVVDKESFPKGGVGAMHDFYPLTADATNLLQSYATGKIPPSSTSSDPSSPKSNSTKGKKAKEGVPILFIEECLHGLLEAHHTLFPQSIGLASTFDPQLVKRVGRAIATEARAFGIHMCLAPVLGIARDPRWGRVEETFGMYLSVVSSSWFRTIHSSKLIQ
ncbi:hypothetical protein HK102_013459 [Quaeritorhiza haematococci]|nr:hypothetical protein HK102_013459 [Quaeritorhiza haematococci]